LKLPFYSPFQGGSGTSFCDTSQCTQHSALFTYCKRIVFEKTYRWWFEGVFEFAKDFRNEGMDRTHNPEFTVMELYVAYKDYFWMMETTENLLEKVAVD